MEDGTFLEQWLETARKDLEKIASQTYGAEHNDLELLIENLEKEIQQRDDIKEWNQEYALEMAQESMEEEQEDVIYIISVDGKTSAITLNCPNCGYEWVFVEGQLKDIHTIECGHCGQTQRIKT